MSKLRLFSIPWFFLFFLAVGLGEAGGDERPVWWERAEIQASQDGYGLITASELKALYDSGEDFRVIDVRPDYEYSAGHLPKAVQIEFDLGDRSNLKPSKRTQLEEVMGEDKGCPIIVYCRNLQ